MRVLLVTQTFHPEVAAAPIRLKNMVESLQERGFVVDVLTSMPNYPKGRIFDGYRGKFSMREKFNNGTIYRYWIYANSSFNRYKRLINMGSFALTLKCFGLKRKLINSYEVIIVQTPQLLVAYSAVKMLSSKCKAKIIINVSDKHPLALVQAGHVKEGSFYYKVLKYFEDYLYKKSDAVMGQSEEILKLVNQDRPIESFLYRTLQKPVMSDVDGPDIDASERKRKLVYAGLLSKMQDVLSIINHIDFKSKGLEFHIYGDGNQKDEVVAHCDGKSVFYHGVLPNNQMMAELKKYGASIVPLSVVNTGAIPSKIYNVVYSGMPVIYMGMTNGEAAELITRYQVGYVADPQDFKRLEKNIDLYNSLNNEQYQQLVDNCRNLSATDFNYGKQMDRLVEFINKIVS